MSFSFSKNERLKSRKRIDLLFRKGRSFHVFPFRVVYQMESASEINKGLQAGVSVSKQYFKKAVDRNRIKRLMRESWRLQKEVISQLVISKNICVSVFILYRGNELPDYSFISSKMTKVIDQLISIINEKNTDHM